MKKLYQSEAFKQYIERKNRREQKRILRRLHHGEGKRRIKIKDHSHRPPRKLTAPSVFSLTENVEETISFFAFLFESLKRKYPVDINLRGVNKLTPDTILYLLSLLDMFEEIGLHVTGNTPSNIEYREIFTQSGFYNYVKSNFFPPKSNKNILTV